MLYFTFASGRTLGIFSGRFAFKLHKDADGNPESLVGNIEGSVTEQLGQTIKHERAHHAVAKQSILSKGLVGSRFIARVNFARGNLSAVHGYYERRTIFFALAYRLHEALVDRMIRQNRFAPTAREINAINSLDHHIGVVADEVGSALSFSRLSVSFALGCLATKEFGVVLAIQAPDGTTRLREAASRAGFAGIFNSAFQPSRLDNVFVRAVKFLHRKLNIEALAARFGRSLDQGAILSWGCCKLIAEYRAVVNLFDPNLRCSLTIGALRVLNRAIGKYENPNDYFRVYLQNILPFALGFQGEDLRASFSDICVLIDEVMDSIQLGRLDGLSARSNELLSKACGLFFYHGN